MSLTDEKNDLLKAVMEPQRKKSQPSNMGLYAAIVFANLVFCAVDIISAISVTMVTGFIMYGILTFMAGFAPLLLHEFLFVRAFASEFQKKLAITGAVISLVSIVGIGVASAVVNVNGAGSMDAMSIELVVIISIVLIAIVHAILSILYFYSDDGIKANQLTSQAIARALHQAKMIEASETVLGAAQAALLKQNLIASMYDNPAAVKAVLKQMGWDQDADGDGTPDILQQSPAFARPQRPPVPGFSPNGHKPQPMQAYSADFDMVDPT